MKNNRFRFGEELEAAFKCFLSGYSDYSTNAANAGEIRRSADRLVKAIDAEQAQRERAGTLTRYAQRALDELRADTKSARLILKKAERAARSCARLPTSDTGRTRRGLPVAHSR